MLYQPFQARNSLKRADHQRRMVADLLLLLSNQKPVIITTFGAVSRRRGVTFGGTAALAVCAFACAVGWSVAKIWGLARRAHRATLPVILKAKSSII